MDIIKNIHIVDSVKGGAGKSTFALKLGYYFALKKNGKDKDKVKACIIDLDILGTSWVYNFKSVFNPTKEEIVYLNDLIVDYNYYSKQNFITGLDVKNDNTDSESVIVDVIPCNPSPRAKAMFRTDGQTMPEVSYDFFEEEMVRLIDKLDKQGYTDIILDMPPNTEPYSGRILESCLQVNKTLYKQHRILLYMVSSLTQAHIGSTFHWYKDWIEAENTRSVTPDKKQKPLEHFKNDYKNNKDDKKAWFSPEGVEAKESVSFCFVVNNINKATPKPMNEDSTIVDSSTTVLDSFDSFVVDSSSFEETVKKRLVFCFLRFDKKINDFFNIIRNPPATCFTMERGDFQFFVDGEEIELKFP